MPKDNFEFQQEKHLGDYQESFKVTIKDDIKEFDNINNISFYLQGCVSGCGLAVIGGLTGQSLNYPDILQFTKPRRDRFVKALVKYLNTSNVRAAVQAKGYVIATLGNSSYAKKENEDNLLDMGFKFLYEFDNLAHVIGSRQRVYGLEIKRK